MKRHLFVLCIVFMISVAWAGTKRLILTFSTYWEEGLCLVITSHVVFFPGGEAAAEPLLLKLHPIQPYPSSDFHTHLYSQPYNSHCADIFNSNAEGEVSAFQ